MADFCNLCGYNDIHVDEIYEKHIRPFFSLEMAEGLRDDEFFSCGIGGICEHCGLIAVGVDNKFNFLGVFIEAPKRTIGHINKETFDLTLDEDGA